MGGGLNWWGVFRGRVVNEVDLIRLLWKVGGRGWDGLYACMGMLRDWTDELLGVWELSGRPIMVIIRRCWKMME
jgi:hypothetical protein